MFDALTPATLTTPPRKGIGARIVRGLGRMGAALHGVVAGRLRRRPSAHGQLFGPDADGSTAAKPARAPRQPRRTAIGVPDRQDDLAFTEAAFPDLSPGAREFFNTPLEDCDPAMLGLVLEALADAIAGQMTPQEGMRDARDVFLALNSRLGALTGGMQGTPPESVPADPDAAGTPADAGRDRSAGSGARTCLARRRRRRCRRPMAAPAHKAKRPLRSQGRSARRAAGRAAAIGPCAHRHGGAGTNTTHAPHDSGVGPRPVPAPVIPRRTAVRSATLRSSAAKDFVP